MTSIKTDLLLRRLLDLFLIKKMTFGEGEEGGTIEEAEEGIKIEIFTKTKIIIMTTKITMENSRGMMKRKFSMSERSNLLYFKIDKESQYLNRSRSSSHY